MVAMDGSAPEHVRWTQSEPTLGLRRPTLIAAFEGWNDAGDAATIAARALSKRWRCEQVADIDPEPFFDFTSSRPSIGLDDRRARRISWPSNELRTGLMPAIDTDVVMLIGVEPHLRWRTFCDQVIGAARMLEVERVITLGALLAEVPYSRDVQVYGSANDEIMVGNEVMGGDLDLRPTTYEGPTGIVGVLSSACRDAGFDTVSFWAAVPSYLPGARSPKAALALVRRVSSALGMPVPTADLERAARTYESEVSKIVSSDEETAEFVARLEKAWDLDRDRAGSGRKVALRDHPDRDDPGKLVAEVEEFLRDTD